MKHPAFTITLADMRQGPPVEIRLRRLLKIARRMFALECIDITETKSDFCPSAPGVRESAPGGLTAGASPAVTVTRQTAGEKSSV
jgi:hypothetical protein